MHSEFTTSSNINVYIDGFNLYHGICATYDKSLLWLDLIRLINYLKQPEEIIHQIKYFTTIPDIPADDESLNNSFGISDESDRVDRHRMWISVLEKSTPPINVIKGKFHNHPHKPCRFCGKTEEKPRRIEKRTDVNIAVEMIIDAVDNHYQTAYILSADSDLLPVIHTLKNKFHKRVVVVFPPKRQSIELMYVPDKLIRLNRKKLKRFRLPVDFISKDGTVFSKPDTWTYHPPR